MLWTTETGVAAAGTPVAAAAPPIQRQNASSLPDAELWVLLRKPGMVAVALQLLGDAEQLS